MTVFASSTSTTVLVRTSFCRRIAVHLPPEFRADMVWVSGAFVYRHINRCGSAQLFKKEFIR